MKMMKRCVYLAAFLFCQNMSAQQIAPNDSVRIYFRQSIDTLDLNYRSNKEKLDLFSKRLLELKEHKVRFRNVQILSSASPEGPSRLNESLAKNRAEVLSNYIRNNVELSNVEFEVVPVELDWELFSRLVSGSDLKEKEQVLYIIMEEPIAKRKRLLRELSGGNVWNEMLRTLYPDMRTCVFYINYSDSAGKVDEPVLVKPDMPLAAYRIGIPPQELVSATRKKNLVMGVKTNLLYDALAVPNLGVEFYLGKGWSLGGNWMYARYIIRQIGQLI